MADEETPILEMDSKAIRKELRKRFGYDKSFLKGQPDERVSLLLINERKEYHLVEEAKADLRDNYGYDPEYLSQQSASELIRQRSLEEAGRIAKTKVTGEPVEEAKPKKRKAKKAKAEPVDEMGFGQPTVIDTSKPPVDDEDDIEAEYQRALATPNEDLRFDGETNLLIKDPDTWDYVFNGHAGAGPSASERWLHCTASLEMSRKFLETLSPNQQREFAKANISARQGTTAHAVGETEANLLLGRIDDTERDNLLMALAVEPEDGEAYDEEMAEYVQEYVDLIAQYIEEKGTDNILVERRVVAYVPLHGDHEDEVYEVPGSADLIALPTPEDKTLVVADLKYGNGVDVEVEENTQAQTYALGVLSDLVDDEGNLTVEIETIRIHIIQPRLGGIKTWEITLDDLIEWRDTVMGPQLTKALYGKEAGAEFAPSESACQFCPARGTCPALAEERLIAAQELFDVVLEAEYKDGPGSFPDATLMDDATLGTLLTQVNGVVDLQKELKAEVQRRMHRGAKVPGFKLVSYTPKRTWKDDAEEVLNEHEMPVLWQRKMLTPTQALAALKRDEELAAVVQEYIEVPDKRPVVAPENDRRKTWEGKAPEEMFEDLTEGD